MVFKINVLKKKLSGTKKLLSERKEWNKIEVSYRTAVSQNCFEVQVVLPKSFFLRNYPKYQHFKAFVLEN